MDMIGKVKRMHFRDHLSFSDIARRTGLSRNTVKKWVKAPAEVEPRYRRDAVTQPDSNDGEAAPAGLVGSVSA